METLSNKRNGTLIHATAQMNLEDVMLWERNCTQKIIYCLIPLTCVLCLSVQSCPGLCDPWTVTCQASLSIEFSRQEYWSGLNFLLQYNKLDTHYFIDLWVLFIQYEYQIDCIEFKHFSQLVALSYLYIMSYICKTHVIQICHHFPLWIQVSVILEKNVSYLNTLKYWIKFSSFAMPLEPVSETWKKFFQNVLFSPVLLGHGPLELLMLPYGK